MLHQLQQLKEPQLPSLKGPILRLKAAVDDLGRCCAEWTKPGWLWELAAGRLDISDFLAVHKLVLEVTSLPAMLNGSGDILP